MDKGDRIAIIVGLALLGLLIIGALLNLAGVWMMGQGERAVLGSSSASQNSSASPVSSPSPTPSVARPDRLR